MIFFDLKLNSVTDMDKGHAGRDVAGKLIDHLLTENNGGPYSEINILMSIPHTHDAEFVIDFMDEVQRRNLPPRVVAQIG